MKTKDIYDLAVKLGVEADLRDQEEVTKFLNRVNKKYDALSDKDKLAA